MYIVYIGTQKHSAWLSMEEAKHQGKVLRDHGYGKTEENDIWIDYIQGANYENGHYFI